MKKEFISSLLLTIQCLFFFCIVYTGIVYLIALLSPNKGEGEKMVIKNGIYYYANIAQSFTADKYFWSRPSAVGYNAAGSGGSNKGPNNPDYLADVQKRIDSFMAHNPDINRSDIPSDLVTASGSGLDPDISIQAAIVQVPRIAITRGLSQDAVKAVVDKHIDKPLLGFLGPEKINVLKLNIDLDNLR
jgi:K+-transporting ATPase ATPase C chain